VISNFIDYLYQTMLAMLAILATPRKERATTRLQSLKFDHMLGKLITCLVGGRS
jgi:hypothetical protein